MNKEQAQALRAPFPREVVGTLPKGGTQLRYVGHAAVTDRLLSIDPEWTWDFNATDEHGNPLLDREGNLWIRLTVAGVTRLGVGDGKTMKERIGDAIRNGAMRFGVALDLWTKDELESVALRPPSSEFADLVASATTEQELMAIYQQNASTLTSKERALLTARKQELQAGQVQA